MIKLSGSQISILDIIVPFGRFLRHNEGNAAYHNWQRMLIEIIPRTFFFYWLFSLIPYVGTTIYALILVPLSASIHLNSEGRETESGSEILLVYFVVILIGFGGLWSFIGHTVLADSVATQIGWATGSPFQIELAFYTLGSAVAALLVPWIRDHIITALVISKSIFWYGAGIVHIQDAIVNGNYSPLNIGAPLINDLIFPTFLLILWKRTLNNR